MNNEMIKEMMDSAIKQQVDAEIGGRIMDLIIQDRKNAFVRHYEQIAKQHWTERNDRNLNEEN
jgi:hypothetical protein